MKNHEYFIRKCNELAKVGIGNVSPNPMVGSIIVYKNKIIGQGFHEKYGKEHAEVNAIKSVKDISLLKKSTLYVNLEPCCHFGKTPPCSELIIKEEIPTVVVGCLDPNPKVSGNGIKKLKENSIKVIYGILEKECLELNKRFFTFIQKKRPYIILKWAKSADNFIAPIDQTKPFWMTSEQSRMIVHRWRSEEDSIFVGTNTVILDNPSLDVRLTAGENPIRIIIDKNLSFNKDMNVFNNKSKTIIFNEIKTLSSATNYYLKVNFKNLISEMLNELYNMDITSIIVEGGAYTLNKFIDKNIYDEVRVFTTKTLLKKGIKSPIIPDIKKILSKSIDNDLLDIYIK